MSLVVSLGAVDQELVERVLGSNHTLVQEPSDADLAVAVGAIVRASVTVDRAMLDRMPRLRVLARTGVGTERVDLVAASDRGIPVVVTPGSNTNAVAEGALALALHILKQIRPLTDLVREGNWDQRGRFPLGDIEGSTVGIIGYGRIGRRLASIVTAMGAKVIAYDPIADIPKDQRAATVDDLLKVSNIVSLHAPLTDDNHHMLNRESIALLPQGAIVVNCGRGPLIDLDAALEHLNSGHLGGLGLDVFDAEPPTIHPVFSHPNVALTPHVMGLSLKAAAQTFIDAAQGVRDVLDGREPVARAN